MKKEYLVDKTELICDECSFEKCNKCSNRLECKCVCNRKLQLNTKIVATSVGVATAVSGLAITVLSSGIALPLMGSVLLSAGVSSSFQGVDKIIKNETIKPTDFASDVGLGAVIGGFTGGIGAASLVVLGSLAKNIAIRSAIGAVTNFGAKAISELKECASNQKDWKDFGKKLNIDGQEWGSVTSWITAGTVGAIGGVSGYFAGNLNSIGRICASATTALITDTVGQSINIITGNQETFETKQTIENVIASTCLAAGQEASLKCIYSISDGNKHSLVKVKASRFKIKSAVPKKKLDQALTVDSNLREQKLDELKNYKGKHHIHHLNGKLKNQIEADLREHHNSGCVKSNKCKNAKQFDQVMSNISENANKKEFFGHECLF